MVGAIWRKGRRAAATRDRCLKNIVVKNIKLDGGGEGIKLDQKHALEIRN